MEKGEDHLFGKEVASPLGRKNVLVGGGALPGEKDFKESFYASRRKFEKDRKKPRLLV